jgi:surface carbohydrate biosynthesis protein
MRIYIGSKIAIERLLKNKNNKGGIFIYKGGMEISKILRIKEKIEKFIILDQEISPSTLNLKKEIRRRIWPGSEKYIDYYFTVGQRAFDASVDILKNQKLNIIKTGWPRIDLLRSEFKFLYKKEIDEINKNYGNFILFSSDFGYNSIGKKKYVEKWMKNSKWENIINDLEHKMSEAKITLDEFKANIDFFKKLDNDITCPQIIIRPHPAEDHDEWHKIQAYFKKIKIVFRGSIEPWIYASSALLHRGCMSAINAYMTGIPIGYLTLQKNNIKKALPYKLSEHFDNIKDVIQFCKRSIDQKLAPKKKYSAIFKKYIHIEEKYSCEIILENFTKHNLFSETQYQPTIQDKFYDIFINFQNMIKKIINFFYLQKYKDIAIAPQSQKMPGGIRKKEVRDILFTLSTEDDFIVKQVFKDCVLIESK